MANRLEESAYRHIRQMLMLGQLPPGSRVSDQELAAEMGISRTPVREALIRLRNERFVEQVPRLGTFIRQPSVQELMDLHELRRVLESHAVSKAAKLATEDDVLELERLCGELRFVAHSVRGEGMTELPVELAQRMVVADISFHLRILQIAGNARLLKIVSDLQLMTVLCGHSYRDPATFSLLRSTSHTYRDHARVCRAIRRRRPKEARYWMRRHIRSQKEMSEYFEQMHRRLAAQEAMPGDWPDSVRASIYDLEQQPPKPKPRGERSNRK